MADSSIVSHPLPPTDSLSHLHLSDQDQSPEPITMLTLLKTPCKKKSSENDVRQWFCFGLNSNKSSNHHPIRHTDRPRLVTNWKTETETHKQIANSLDSPPPLINQFSVPDSNEPAEPLSLRSIPDEILLPFGERENEIMELLNDSQNIGLYNRFKELLGSRWPNFECEILRASRPVLCDREWIKAIRASFEPLDLNLWVRFRGMIGADGLDEEAVPSTEHDWLIQPVKIRRSSVRSPERRRRVIGLHDRSSRDSFVSVFGDSDQESVISVASHSPIAMMESIQEQEVSEFEQEAPAFEPKVPVLDSYHSKIRNHAHASTSPSYHLSSDSDSEEPDEHHALALKILERPPSFGQHSPECTSNQRNSPSHGLKYSFGQVTPKGPVVQSLQVR